MDPNGGEIVAETGLKESTGAVIQWFAGLTQNPLNKRRGGSGGQAWCAAWRFACEPAIFMVLRATFGAVALACGTTGMRPDRVARLRHAEHFVGDTVGVCFERVIRSANFQLPTDQVWPQR